MEVFKVDRQMFQRSIPPIPNFGNETCRWTLTHSLFIPCRHIVEKNYP